MNEKFRRITGNHESRLQEHANVDIQWGEDNLNNTRKLNGTKPTLSGIPSVQKVRTSA